MIGYDFTKPVVGAHIGRRLFVLLEPVIYRTRDKYTIEVPAGLITDGASVPAILTPIYPRYGEYFTAAVVHDWLYWTQEFPRKIADEDFRNGMIDSGVPILRSWLLWSGVRLGGWWGWWQNKRKRKRGNIRVIEHIGQDRWWTNLKDLKL